MLGDCLEQLATLPDCSIDAIVTDPPYGLSFMGKKWDCDVPSEDIWKECLRVLKPGGHLLAFAGTRTQHRMAVRIEDAGFEIRDLVMWHYGSGFPKSTDISRRIDLEEQKRWLDVCKALDNLEITAIMEAWKDHSRIASTAGLSFAKSTTATGISTPKSGSAPEPVVLQAIQESSDALALVAELSFKEAHLTSEAEISSALMPAAASESQNPVKCAEHLRKRSSVIYTRTGIAQCAVKELPSESMAGNLKAVEALRTWLGSKPSSMQEATNVLCAALTDDLKLITLNQSKTFRNFDTTRQTACASAISVTITESMAECLISFTVDTLRKQATDKAAGAERERVAGPKSGGMASLNKGNASQGYRDSAYYEEGNMMLSSEPATPEARQWQGWGTALKPATEIVTMARKPLVGTVAANVLAHGTGGLNVDGCRVEAEPELAKNWQRSQSTAAQEGRNSMNGGLNTIDLRGYTPAGRWPANLIHDGSDEVVGLFPSPHGAGAKREKGQVKHGDHSSIFGIDGHDSNGMRYGDSGSAARFFYCAKTSKRERGEGNNHPTVKPIALMRHLCRLVTPPGGTILDPFMGSGSTGMAAEAEGFDFVGVELDPDYFAIAQRRMKTSEPSPEGLVD